MIAFGLICAFKLPLTKTSVRKRPKLKLYFLLINTLQAVIISQLEISVIISAWPSSKMSPWWEPRLFIEQKVTFNMFFSFILTVSVQFSIQLYLYSINNNSLLCRTQCLMQGEPLLTEVTLSRHEHLQGNCFIIKITTKRTGSGISRMRFSYEKNMIKSQSPPYLRVTVPQNKWTGMP